MFIHFIIEDNISKSSQESVSEESTETEHKVHGASPWKPQLHFCWDVILDELLQPGKKHTRFQDFYRLAVDGMADSLTTVLRLTYLRNLIFYDFVTPSQVLGFPGFPERFAASTSI